MERVITATDANRSFSEVLRQVEDGETVAVTKRGVVVARIVPSQDDAAAVKRRRDALTALMARWDKQPVQSIGRWSRDELYD